MDVNLTYPIAANITLTQSWWVPWIPAIIGVLGAILGAIAGGMGTYYLEKLKIDNNESQERRQLYSKLLGIKYPLIRLHYLHGDAFLQSRLQYIRYKSQFSLYIGEIDEKGIAEKERLLREAPPFKLAKQKENEARDYSIKLIEIDKSLWEIIGFIQVSFNNTEKLDGLIAEVEIALSNYSRDILKASSEKEDKSQIEDIRDRTLSNYIDNIIEPSINNLLSYLREEIGKNDKY